MRQLVIRNPFNAPVYHEETVGSTMDLARLLASGGEAHGAVIAADFQEAGRGRTAERSWNMDRGTSLPFTVLLRYPRIEEIPQAITLRAGLAVALGIEDFMPSLAGRALIKWPNDIMIGSKKAAGILSEAGGGAVYIGVGINVAQREFPAFLREKAVSLGLAAQTEISAETRFTLLEHILARLHAELEPCAASPGWRGRVEQRLYKKGETVCFIDGPAGSAKTVEGRLAGIGGGGELLIIPRGETRARPFITGELRVYPAA
jgi:BirA family biotin operon repressor/biotin-[acetyl-CoA-carboxylase] ligase